MSVKREEGDGCCGRGELKSEGGRRRTEPVFKGRPLAKQRDALGQGGAGQLEQHHQRPRY
jgi:hypothetical protein